MRTFERELKVPEATDVAVTEAELRVSLSDGRTLSAPIAWYPRLLHGTPAERNRWELIAGGDGIHWPDLDEDISVEGLLRGNGSFESDASFQRWLDARSQRRSA